MNIKEYQKNYQRINKDRISEQHKEYVKNNLIKIRQLQKEWREKNKEYCKKYQRNYRKLNKERIKKQRNGREKIYNKKYYEKYKEKILNQQKEYYQLNKIKIRPKRLINILKRLNKDINFRITHYLRHRIYMALKGNPKHSTTMKLVGCSIDKLKKHLQSKFTNGMSWNNWGTGWHGKGFQEWQIDHIRPCASFDLRKKSEQRKCFHYTNLQPLWAIENIIKKDKII